MTGEVCKAIAQCFELQILDLTGSTNIDEMGIGYLKNGTKPPVDKDEKPIVVGLKQLRMLKLNNLPKVFESSILQLMR